LTGPSKAWQAWRKQVDLDEYERRWEEMAASGANPHGEADFVMRSSPTSVLDAGCGTGRLGIELARRGVDVVGADLDDDLLAYARRKAPVIPWVHSDLSVLELGRTFDVVVMAGNVLPFAMPSIRPAIVAALARHLRPDGRLIAGFSLNEGWPTAAEYDQWCADAGLVPAERARTWQSAPFSPETDNYLVAVHKLPER
jgi:SAM-dependent methyltransferase